jgi:UDPglucose 6-dehydrogenase
VDHRARVGIDPRVTVVSSSLQALQGADVVFIATAWPEFAAIDWAAAAHQMRKPILVDGRNALRAVALPPAIRYFRVGRVEGSASSRGEGTGRS